MDGPIPERHLRPASVGEMIDRALRLYRRHVRPLYTLMLLAELPIFLLQKLFEAGMREVLPRGALAAGGLTPEEATRILSTLGISVPLIYAAMLTALALGRGALLLAGARAWRGGTPTVGETGRRLRARLKTLLSTYGLLLLLFTVWLALAAAPGVLVVVAGVLGASIATALTGLVLAGLVPFVVLLFLYLRWYLVLPVVVLEGLGGLAALRRSRALMAGRVAPGPIGLVKIRASLLLLVLFLLLAVPGLLLGAPQYLLAAAYTPAGLPPNVLEIPLLLRLPFDVAGILLSALLTPLGILAQLFFYFDQRIRREGLDLQLMAGAEEAVIEARPVTGRHPNTPEVEG